MLGYWDNGIRHMTNSKRPITKVEDMKGLKMRTPPDAVLVDIMQSLGAEAQQIKFAELYVALAAGRGRRAGEPADEHPRQQAVRGAEAPGADRPPVPDDAVPDEQAQLGQAVRRPTARPSPEAAAEATALQRKLSQESDDKLLADLKAKGVQVTTVDKAAFEKATAAVDDKWMAVADRRRTSRR